MKPADYLRLLGLRKIHLRESNYLGSLVRKYFLLHTINSKFDFTVLKRNTVVHNEHPLFYITRFERFRKCVFGYDESDGFITEQTERERGARDRSELIWSEHARKHNFPHSPLPKYEQDMTVMWYSFIRPFSYSVL